MKIRLVFVSTVDGKITRWHDPDVRKWSSDEDKDHFSRLWKDAKLIVMGSNTYKANPPKPSEKRLIVVVTRNPPYYSGNEVKGQLEFRDLQPRELVDELEKQGYGEMMLVGGPQLAASFLEENLVDELWLTLEPKMFGNGGNLVPERNLDVSMQLTDISRMNEKGTLLLRYSIPGEKQRQSS